MNDAVNRVLDLRSQKERIQQSNLFKAKRHLESCEAEVRRQREALEQFRAWRQGHEESLFAALQKSRATPRDLMEYLARCELLKQEESARAQALAAAEQALDATRNGVVRARQASRDATRAKEKLSELVSELKKGDALAQRLADENELDESILSQVTRPRRI